MSVRFFDQFLIHMMLPLGCCLAIVVAWGVAHRCTANTNIVKHTQINEAISKVLILVILLLFPGLSTKVFQVWKCTSVDGMEGQYLVQDFKIQCNQGEHVIFVVLAIGFLLLYIVGIPLTMFVLMFRNRKVLHDESSPKHHAIKNALGGLYIQYEPNYWWFELAILLNKTMMCGGLVVLNPGSPTQVVCAILIMQFHLLLVLKTAPYVNDSEDWTAFGSSLGLTLTYVGALIKMLQDEVRKSSDKNANKLNYADTAMNILPIACVSIVVLIMIFVDCGLWNYMRWKKKNQDNGNGSLTQVKPIIVSSDEVRNFD
jgi:hypothetical protein